MRINWLQILNFPFLAFMLDFVPNKDPSVVFNIARFTSQSKDKFALGMNKSTHDVSPFIFLAGVQINQRDLATLLIG